MASRMGRGTDAFFDCGRPDRNAAKDTKTTEAAQVKKFWMVLGEGQPTHRHETKESARLEAERLARQRQAWQFHVLEAVAAVRMTNLVWEQHEPQDEPVCENHDDIPF